jgi:hypothetical protein
MDFDYAEGYAAYMIVGHCLGHAEIISAAIDKAGAPRHMPIGLGEPGCPSVTMDIPLKRLDFPSNPH